MKKLFSLIFPCLVLVSAYSQMQRYRDYFAGYPVKVGTATYAGSEAYNPKYCISYNPNFYKYDIYQPDPAFDKDRMRACIIFVHGGGFVGEDKIDFSEQCTQWAQRGYVVMSLNYSLAKTTQICANQLTLDKRVIYNSLQDVVAACKHILGNGTTYGINVNNVYLSGYSAGGILALSTAYITDAEVLSISPTFNQELGMLNKKTMAAYKNIPLKFKAVSAMAGAIPQINFLSIDDNTPLQLIHNEHDTTVPYGFNEPNGCNDGIKDLWGSQEIFNNLSKTSIPYAQFYTETKKTAYPIPNHVIFSSIDVKTSVANFFYSVMSNSFKTYCDHQVTNSGSTTYSIYKYDYYSSNACYYKPITARELEGATDTEAAEEFSDMGAVYPNPSRGIWSLSPDTKKGVKLISVTNKLGMLIFATDTAMDQINLENESNDIYFLSITYQDGTQKRLKIEKTEY